jgi:ribosomal protein S7
LIEGVLAVLSTSVDVNPVSAVILAMNSLATLAFISLVTLYAQRLTINIIDALNSTSTSSALSAKQGSILKGLVDSKANSTGDNSV